MDHIVQRWNTDYFDGELSAACLGLLTGIPGHHPEVVEFAERSLRGMHEVGLRARDLSVLFAWELGHIMPKIHPRAWGGMVPPITLEGRHERVDDYVASNPWQTLRSGDTFLDVGCGFPPHTTVDTARRFPDWTVVGTDPAFGRYLVHDEHEDYAVFNTADELRYFQAGKPDPARWEALTRDPSATKQRFLDLLTRLRRELDDEAHDELRAVEAAGARLTFNPIRAFELPNLRFEQKGIAELQLPSPAAVVRCFNVLLYFDRSTRVEARRTAGSLLREGGLFIEGMNWARTTYARYTVSQKRGDALHLREFAFSIDNVRPMDIIPFFTFFDDDEQGRALHHCMRVLRLDQDFRAMFDRTLDDLCATHRICARGDDGYLGGVDPTLSPEAVDKGMRGIVSGLEQNGLVEGAVAVLQRAGVEAWRNPAGHVAVDPASIPAFAQDTA